MRKRWMITSFLVGLLTVGVAGGAVLANDHEEGSPFTGFGARVAEILGIDQAQIEEAFKQAREEMADERLQAKLDAQVEAGRITQEQADEYIEWYQSRPDDGIGIGPMGRSGGIGHFKRGRGFRGGFGHHGSVRPTAPAPTTPDTTSL
jgi:hypothetical protein